MAIEQAEESVGRCLGPSVQDILAGDLREAPVVLRTVAPPADLGTDDVSIDRYFSPQWHDREVAAVWQKCWQMACRVGSKTSHRWATMSSRTLRTIP